MRRHLMPEMKEGGVNVTPLIDVVMCLIIFFMLVAKIGINDGSAEQVDLPKSLLGKSIDDMGNTLIVNVKIAAGEERLGRIRRNQERPDALQVLAIVDGDRRELPVVVGEAPNLRFPLREVLKEFKKRFKDQFKLIVRCDRDMSFGLLQDVLAEAANAGVTNLAFNTEKGEEAYGQAAP